MKKEIRIEKEMIGEKMVSVRIYASAKNAGKIIDKIANDIVKENGWTRKDCYISFRCGEKGRVFVKHFGFESFGSFG